jgi:ATP-binding cassette, subfamily B, bacterial
MSFAQNIAVGNINEKDNRVLIESAAQKSLADSLAEKLPNKYDQALGRRFNEGTELSGGNSK